MPTLKRITPPPGPKPEPLLVPRMALSVQEAAEASGLSKSYLYLEMKAGNLKYMKAGSRRLIRVADLEVFLAGLSQGPEAA